MKKIYGFNNRWTEDDVMFLKKFNIIISTESSGWFSIDADPVSVCIHDHFCDKKQHPYFREHFHYEYSKEDINSSEYCVLCSIRGKGYPLPTNDNWAWDELYYDTSNFCRQCGHSLIQTQDFRVTRSTRPTKHPFWTFFDGAPQDVAFLTDELYETLFKPLGFGCRPVRKASGEIFEGILQLDIPIIDEDLDLSMHEYEICPVCGKKKYGGDQKYPFFPLHEHPLPHLYLSKEYFGYGMAAGRKMFISTELAKVLLERKLIQDYALWPCRKNLAEYLKTIEY